MNVRIAIAIPLSLLLLQPAFADDFLQQAKQLYDAAEYDSVLSMTREADVAGLSVELREYRALSLLALSRTTEAEQEIALLFNTDPFYAPAPTAPPRWRAAVDRVRTRVRPEMVRSRYSIAKQLFDSRDFSKAVTEFETLKALLAMAQKEGIRGLDDLVTLTDGFLQLSRNAAPPPASAPAVVEAPAPAVVTDARAPVVKPPVAIERSFPRWDPPAFVNLRQSYDGRIGVSVAADGSVKSVRVLDSIHASYDSVLMAAARKWRFEPATRNGEAVAYEVEIPVQLTPSAAPR